MFFGLRQQLTSSLPFILVLGSTELKDKKNYGNLIEQDKNRNLATEFVFDVKEHLLIDKNAILMQFPIQQYH